MVTKSDLKFKVDLTANLSTIQPPEVLYLPLPCILSHKCTNLAVPVWFPYTKSNEAKVLTNTIAQQNYDSFT